MTYKLFNEYDKEIYLTEKEFSILLNLKQNTVSIMRLQGKLPFFTKITRFYLYDKQKAIDFAKNFTKTHIIYDINKTYFKKIDTEKKAYFLGFLYADGGNIGRAVHLCIQKQDEEILQKFMCELKSIQPILHYTNKKGRTYSRISIAHKSMVKDLRKLGIVERKSLTLKFPNFLEENLVRHFIRGYFDGDGSICYCKTTKNVHFSIVSTKKFLDKIKCILSKNINLYSGVYDIKSLKNKSNKSTKRLAITGWNKVNIIMTWLYKDSNIFLDRKHRKFKEITKLKSAQSA